MIGPSFQRFVVFYTVIGLQFLSLILYQNEYASISGVIKNERNLNNHFLGHDLLAQRQLLLRFTTVLARL